MVLLALLGVSSSLVGNKKGNKMALNDYAYYNTSTGLIENVIYIEDEVALTLVWPEGYAVVDLPTPVLGGTWSTCGIGWSYVDGQFVEPPEPPQPEPVTP
jgi:hypothetical protein